MFSLKVNGDASRLIEDEQVKKFIEAWKNMVTKETLQMHYKITQI